LKLAFFLLTVLTLAAAPARRFVVISDIHFNPLADASLVPKLIASEPSQWEDIFAATPTPQAYGQDATWPLLSSLVAGLQKVQPKPKLIIFTGDVLPHHFHERFEAISSSQDPAAFRAFVRKDFDFVSMELQKAAGGVPVVYTVGNNDEECGDYELQPGGPFLIDIAAAVKTLAQVDDKAFADWSATASYAVDNPLAPHYRILALNSTYWSRRYKNACGTGADPGQAVLDWLSAQLMYAQKQHDKVWLAYHIPPGIDGHSSARAKQTIDFWNPKYAAAFYQLLDQYRGTIDLSLAGHTHLDDMRLVSTAHSTALILINPGLSPNISQNPAFRVITVDRHARPLDVLTYYRSNLNAPEWKLEYSTRPAYRLKRIDASDYQSLYREIAADPRIGDKWRLYYSVSHAAGVSTDKTYLRSLYCADGNVEDAAYEACMAKPQ
jgi:sphingomyelin phosphodiesterase acid-like 3